MCTFTCFFRPFIIFYFSSSHPRPVIPHRLWQRRRTLFDRGWGELHPLQNNRKGSFSATYNKNDEANNVAYNINLKTMHALGTVVEVFEATMKKVTLEHEVEMCSGLFGG